MAEINPSDIHWSCWLAATDTTQIMTEQTGQEKTTGTHPNGVT